MSEYTTDQVLKMMEEWHAQHSPEDAEYVEYPFRGFDLLVGRDLSDIDLSIDTIKGKAKEWSAQHGGTAPPWLSVYSDQGINLSGAVLSEDREGRRTDLIHAQLQGAWLEYAQLQGARLRGVQLQGARLWYAQLQGAYLYGAQLQNTSLMGVQLQEALLTGVQLKEAHLEDVDWRGGYVLGEEKKRIWVDGGDDYEQKGRNWGGGEAVYRELKRYYTGTGQYQQAGEFHKREMLMRRKGLWDGPDSQVPLRAPLRRQPRQVWEKAEKLQGPVLSFRRWITRRWWRVMDRCNALFLLLLGLTCGYGERPSWAVGWTMASWLAFALAYSLWASLPFPRALFFSALAFSQFTPPGNSFDQVPEWARTAALAESVLAYFFLALFLVTFVRKTEHL